MEKKAKTKEAEVQAMPVENNEDMPMSAEAAAEVAEVETAAEGTDAVNEEEPVQESADMAGDMTDAEQEEEAAPAEEAAAPAPQRRQRRPRQRMSQDEMVSESANYMGDYYHVVKADVAYKEELDRIKAIIAHNREVSRTGEGEYQFMVAMMTANDEVRENNDPNNLRAVRVYAVQVLPNGRGFGTLRLVFTGEDFTAYSNIVRDEDESDSEILRRQRRYTNHAPMSKFQCVPVEISYPDPDENGNVGLPSVICSRAFAMEKQQDRFFFGDEPLAKVGAHGPAYIMSADSNGVRVEFMGIETRITRGQLTSRHLVTDASESYKPGMAIDVAIRELEVDKENRTIKIRLSGVLREIQLGLVKNVRDIDLTTKPHEVAQVVVVTERHYIVRLLSWGIIGIIAKENVNPKVPLSVRDNVWMEITGVNEKYNRVIGNCFKI
ncbi:hypothetical protein [Candidatus Allofournierella merdipullorum]|uniref:hypothetical protein n=1 Tax=Candidatus Allofournierella merdipullorum TaxID=2838595 RepID=UPI00374ECB97